MSQYIVKKGDNLSTIAKKNGIKLNEILKLNKLDDPNLIQIGQKINLPVKVESTNTISLKNNTTKPYKEFLEDQLKTNSSKWQGATKKSNSAPQLYKNFNQAEEKPVAKIALNKPVKKTTTVKKEVNEKDDSSLFEDINNTISKYSQMASTTYKRKIKPLFEDKYDDENSTTKMNLQTPKKVITYDNITGSPIKDPEMGADIYHRSRYIDLNNPEIKTGIHNRGTKIKGDQPFKQILFSNFDNKKFESINPSNIKDDSFYIGQDDTGKIIMGNGKDLKSKKGSISEFSIIKDITGFSKINNNIETSKSKDAKRANNPYLVNDKNEKVPLNILSSTDDNGNDKYGQWYGGSLIVTSPDMKKKVLISGSLNEVNQGLEKFKKDINATNPVKIKKYISKEKHSYIARIDLYSKKIVDDLKHHGLYPNKTHTLSWDNITKNIPDNFIIDFVRGFFDGDGSWKVSKNRITFNVSSVSKDFIEPFSEWFSKMINVKSYKIYKSNHITSTMYSYERAKKEDLIKIYKVLYNGEVCLDRKYLRAKSFIIT